MKKIFILKSWKILILVCAVIGLGALFAIAYTELTRYFIDMVQKRERIFLCCKMGFWWLAFLLGQ